MTNVITFILFIILIFIICFIICKALPILSKRGFSRIGGVLLHKELKLTYTISGEDNGLDFSELRKLFANRDDSKGHHAITFIEKPVSEKVHISFGTFGDFIINGKLHKNWDYDPAFFKQKSAIKNTLGNSNHLINKSQLYDTIKKLIPNGIKYLPKGYNIEEIEQQLLGEEPNSSSGAEPRFPLILKKDNSCKQKGVIVVNSKKEYYEAKKELYRLELERANLKKVKPSYNILISEYIKNPLLIKGRKFHLRVYFLLSVISGITRCTVIHNDYLILTAKLPYIEGDYLNDEIHLTGFQNTEKIYNYPEDLQKEYPSDFSTIEHNLNACNKVIAMAMTIANIQHYSESYSGYHIYGLDIMIANNYHPYLLEINSKPGFKTNSNNIFSFILKYTAFSSLGIIRPPIYDAEFIGEGVLTPFASILTGKNKYILIPYLDATHSEINKVHFFEKSKIVDNCAPINIFLIGHHISESNIIGFLALNMNNYLQVAIIEEYQNRGIATAMIAQFLEIYRMRYFTTSAAPIYINKQNMFMIAIAKKLHFIKNKNNHYEYDVNAAVLRKNIQNNTLKDKILTYKIIYENNNDHIHFDIEHYFMQSNSQFVSFVYNLVHNMGIIKHSTGHKHSKNFIYQGAELKSSLDIKILFGIFLVKLWAYQNIIDFNYGIFDKRIKNKEQLSLKEKYTIYDKNMQNYMILDGNNIKEEYYDINNYFIEEYNPPYLLDGKLMHIVYYVVIHVTKNEIVKYYIFSKNIIVTAKDAYMEDLNNADEVVPKYIHTLKKYNLNDIQNICSSYENLYPIIINFLKLLIHYEIKPYSESNSGFLEFPIQIKFIKKGDKYEPVIGKIDNIVNIHKNNIIDAHFVTEYYQWLSNCVILPHFGILSHQKRIKPNYGALLNAQYKLVEYSILEKIHLEFNKERTMVHIYYSGDRMQSRDDRMQSIGNIKLHIKQNEIYIDTINIDTINVINIEINIIFILMEILRSYYAPIQMFLLLNYEKKMDTIAFELEFLKKENYYSRKC